MARHLVDEGCIYREAIAFHSQQAAEKFLKALLVWHGVDFEKTHNLGRLLQLVTSFDTSLASSLKPATALNPYGVDYRYPGDFPDLRPNDAEEASGLAEQVRAAVIPKLPPSLDSAHE